ncbi:MAG TPA: hypothetical protein VMT45_11280 [Thermoanaerobaculaceae bacterium]|nr:hypothetical protein [Thermoanaerobaculaceae bacterium]
MTAPDLLAALAPLLDALRRLGVRHFVGGSIASSAHGVARASIDADVVAELRPEDVDGLLSSLGGLYYVPEARLRDAALRRTSFNVIHLETMLKVDVFVSRDRPFDRRAMERARPAGSEAAGGAPLVLASAEDIVLAKLEWFRRGGEASERQWGDVLGVLRAGGSSLDRRYLEEGARELGVVDLLARALAEADRE